MERKSITSQMVAARLGLDHVQLSRGAVTPTASRLLVGEKRKSVGEKLERNPRTRRSNRRKSQLERKLERNSRTRHSRGQRRRQLHLQLSVGDRFKNEAV